MATWLNSIGVTGIVLEYRFRIAKACRVTWPRAPGRDRAMSVIRSKAKEWCIDPKRIGIGDSAGGQVGADVETNLDQRKYDPIDDVDRPDAA